MMQQAYTQSPMNIPMDDTRLLRKQLSREITCLELQLDRLQSRKDLVDAHTVSTYQEMILSRKQMLNGI